MRALCPSYARLRRSWPAWRRCRTGAFCRISICGAIGWVFLMTMLGYGLGGVPFVRRYFDKVILVIIVASLLPTLLEVMKSRRAAAASASR